MASDAPAILELTKDIIFLDENEVAVLSKDSFKIMDLKGETIFKKPVRINWDIAQAQKNGFKHFMLKEINEQPRILENIFNIRIDKRSKEIIFKEQNVPEEKLKTIKEVFIIACGTAYHAGLVGKYVLESVCALPANIDVSSEFRYRDLLMAPKPWLLPSASPARPPILWPGYARRANAVHQ